MSPQKNQVLNEACDSKKIVNFVKKILMLGRSFFAIFLIVLVFFTMPLFYSMGDTDISYTPRTHVLKKADDVLQPRHYELLMNYIKNAQLSNKRSFILNLQGFKIEFVNQTFCASPTLWVKLKKDKKEDCTLLETFIAASQSREDKQQEEHISHFFRTLFIEHITQTAFYNKGSLLLEFFHSPPFTSLSVLPDTPPPNIFFVNF